MISFYYRAKRDPQTMVEGRVEAENREMAITKLTRQGLFPTLVVPEKKRGRFEFFSRLKFQKLTLADRARFSSELYHLLSGGVSLLRAIEILLESENSPAVAKVLGSLQGDLREGRSFSEALEVFSADFGPFFVNLVKAGETSGGLDTVLNHLAQYLEKEIETRRRVAQAMAYPLFVLGFGVLTVVIMLVGIFPRLAEFYSDMEASLPLITRIVMATSGAIVSGGWIVLALAVILVVGTHLVRRSGSSWPDRLYLGLPLLGAIHQKDEIARMSRALGLLLQNGITIVESLRLATSIVRNRLIRKEVASFQESVVQGKALSRSMREGRWFTSASCHLVMVGEESGKLEQAFQKISEIYEKEIDQKVRLLTTLLEPVLILVVGAIVGVVVIAMLLPIFQMGVLVR